MTNKFTFDCFGVSAKQAEEGLRNLGKAFKHSKGGTISENPKFSEGGIVLKSSDRNKIMDEIQNCLMKGDISKVTELQTFMENSDKKRELMNGLYNKYTKDYRKYLEGEWVTPTKDKLIEEHYKKRELMNSLHHVTGTGYLPGPNGLMKVECVVDEISIESLDHYSSIGGMRVKDKSFMTEASIKLRCCDIEYVGEIGKQLSDFSNIELLQELEKRTEIKND